LTKVEIKHFIAKWQLMTRISVITPSYNRANFIRGALNSVLHQDYPDVEHIVVDGNSTDKTSSILAEHPNLLVIRETDQGVYDALNKGIKLAHGEIIAQLNSDDYFEPKTFSIIVRAFYENPDVDAVSAGARVFELSPSGEKTLTTYGGIKKNDLPFRATMGAPIFNAWFFRKAVFKKIGYYSLKYPLAADRDFLLRFHVAGLKHFSVEKVVYHYCQHPLSLTMNSLHDRQDRVYREMIELAEKYLAIQNDPRLRKCCLHWRDRAFIELFASEVLKRNIKGMMQIASSATQKNPMWPLRLIAAGPSGIVNFLEKRYAK
jgi:glycosyltransferase involved in cell wall biosynthesis